jgi:hypothetical protein
LDEISPLLLYFQRGVLSLGKRSAENRARRARCGRNCDRPFSNLHASVFKSGRARSEQCAQDCERQKNDNTSDARITCTGLSDAFEEKFHLRRPFPDGPSNSFVTFAADIVNLFASSQLKSCVGSCPACARRLYPLDGFLDRVLANRRY